MPRGQDRRSAARQTKRDTVTRIEIGPRAGSAHSDENAKDTRGRSTARKVINDRWDGKSNR